MEDNNDWQNKLCKEFPYLYRHRTVNFWDLFRSPTFGFECGPGWYNILRHASICIMYEIKKSDKLWWFRPYLAMFTEAWNNIMFRQPNWMKRDHIFGKFPRFVLSYHFQGYAVSQIKEKYGTLRFYMNFETSEMSEITSMAETLSEVTCEQCGQIGRLRGKGWYYVSCNEHAREGDKDEET